jgi:hypothetical protein
MKHIEFGLFVVGSLLAKKKYGLARHYIAEVRREIERAAQRIERAAAIGRCRGILSGGVNKRKSRGGALQS